MSRSTLAYRGRSIAVWVDEVELPNGRRVLLDVVRHPGASAVVPFSSERDVLLLRQFRHAAGGTILEVPAGKLDGEAPATCAARELEEEAGRRAGRLVRLGSIWTTPGFTDEVIEVVEMSLDRALELVWSGELLDAKSALALLHAAHHVGQLR